MPLALYMDVHVPSAITKNTSSAFSCELSSDA